MSTQSYLKLVCGNTSDINVHFIDTRVIDGVQVSSVMVDPNLRCDLESEILRSTCFDNCLNDCVLNLRECVQINKTCIFDLCTYVSETYKTCLEEEITNRINGDNDLSNRICKLDTDIGCTLCTNSDIKGINLVSSLNNENTRAKGVEGNLDCLSTSTKGNLVGAINEVNSHVDANANNIGNLGDINEELTSCNLVSAINSEHQLLKSEVNRAKHVEGELLNLCTDAKSDLVSAINEVDSESVKLSGNQTIDGIKSFCQVPRINAPTFDITNSMDITNKDYVDTLVRCERERASCVEGCILDLHTDCKCSLVLGINEVTDELGALESVCSCIKGVDVVASLNKEHTRALDCECALDTKIDEEITRSTCFDNCLNSCVNSLREDVTALKDKSSRVYEFKGSVANFELIRNLADVENGWTYNVTEAYSGVNRDGTSHIEISAGSNVSYVADKDSWDPLGGDFDPAPIYTRIDTVCSEIDACILSNRCALDAVDNCLCSRVDTLFCSNTNIDGVKTFSSLPVTSCTATPSTNGTLVTKGYVDGQVNNERDRALGIECTLRNCLCGEVTRSTCYDTCLNNCVLDLCSKLGTEITTRQSCFNTLMNCICTCVSNEATARTCADANLTSSINELSEDIGDLAALDTTAKSSLVDAINELNNSSCVLEGKVVTLAGEQTILGLKTFCVLPRIIHSAMTPSDPEQVATKSYVDNQISVKTSRVYKFKGSVANPASLPTSGNEEGDTYNVVAGGTIGSITINPGDNVAWTTSGWDKLAGFIDLSPYLLVSTFNDTIGPSTPLNTTAQTDRGAINEIHGELDSAIAKLDADKNCAGSIENKIDTFCTSKFGSDAHNAWINIGGWKLNVTDGGVVTLNSVS